MELAGLLYKVWLEIDAIINFFGFRFLSRYSPFRILVFLIQCCAGCSQVVYPLNVHSLLELFKFIMVEISGSMYICILQGQVYREHPPPQ